MPDIPIEFSAATLPVPVQIALALAATITLLAMYGWSRLGKGLPTLQSSAEIRTVRIARLILACLVVFVIGLAVIVSVIYIALGSWESLRSPSESQPEQRKNDAPNFPGEKPENGNPNNAGDSEADGAD